jgi:hypothetical protein
VISSTEAGLDPLLQSGEHSIVSCLKQGNHLHVLRSALEQMKWPEDQICDLFEADLLASLAYQLAHLHTKGTRDPDGHDVLQYHHIGAEDWDDYVGNLREDNHLSCEVHTTLSNPSSLDNNAEALRTECHKDDNELGDRKSFSIKSIVLTSLNAANEVLGYIV